jgi:hypothetical protein
MSAPKKVREHTREAFRIDAKAEGDHIMIGGWEILEEGKEEKGRWFAIELNRKNAPWAYLKGDPFRNIASLELCAVLTAVMLFGDKLVDVTCKNRLMLTASTDNLGNTYVLQHFMSCKYPLSIVVVELSVQLQKRGLELELGWIPRGQNEEADALTNKEFGGFDMEKRIVKDFGDLEFEILDELMMKAGELDADIKLAKSSKEAKGDKPGDKHLKRKRGETKWKDPW